MKGQDFLEKSKELRSKADIVLGDSSLLEICKEYGEVIVAGSYRADIMIYADLDITIVREKNFSFDDSLEIIKKIYENTYFSNYFLGGDWNNPWNEDQYVNGKSVRPGGAGKYIGLRAFRLGERWNIDLWFISKEEHKKRQSGIFRDWISEPEISQEQKILILQLKHYLHERGHRLSSNYIYDAILNKEIKTFEEALKYLNTISDKLII